MFENDDACDFAAEVAKSSNLSKLEEALDRVLKAGNEYIEAPEATERKPPTRKKSTNGRIK